MPLGRNALRRKESFKALDEASRALPQHGAMTGNLDDGSRPQKAALSSPPVPPEPAAMAGAASGIPPSRVMRTDTAEMLSRQLHVSRSEHVEEWSRLRIRAYKYVNSPCFDITGGVLTFVNLFCLVYETNAGADPEIEAPGWLHPISIIILVCFTTELILRIYAFRARFTGFWDMADLFIVLSDWTFEIVKAVMGTNLRFAAILRILRILRTFRIARAIRSMSIFRELYVMLHGFFSTLKAVFWASLLLGLMLLMWSIILVEFVHPRNMELAKDGFYPQCERCGRAFAGVGASTITLVQQLVAGDSWGLMTIPLMENYPETVPIFMAILVTINVGLLNLILSVIVDSASEVHKQDQGLQIQQRRERMEHLRKDLMHICSELDDDSDGEITKEELDIGFDTIPEFKETLDEMDIGKEELISLFRMMDEDDSDQVSYSEFTDRLVKMKMTDMSMVIVFMKSHLREFERRMLTMVQSMSDTLDSHGEDVAHIKRHVTESAVGKDVYEEKDSNSADAGQQLLLGRLGTSSCATALEEEQPKRQVKLVEATVQHAAELHGSLSEELERLRERINLDLLTIARDVTSTKGGASDPGEKMVPRPRTVPAAGGLRPPEPTAPPAPEHGGGAGESGSWFAPGCCTSVARQPAERMQAAPLPAMMDPRMHRAIGTLPGYGQESRV